MANINFPNDPQPNDIFTVGGKTYTYDGIKWVSNTTITKTDVGLENVQNYGVATQAEAESGSLDNKYMTPLKTKQSIIANTPDQSINELSDIGDVVLTDLAVGSTLVYDGTNWVNENPPITLGVEWDQDTDSLTRLDDAVGLTAGGDFDGFPQYQLRRCMVNDDLSINYYIDPTNPNLIGEVVNTGTYTTGGTANYTGSHGQVMVEIPKFWWKTDEPTSKQYQWRISDGPQAGFTVHPAFITDGVTKDYIYMSAFEGNVSSSVMRSISGVQPTTSTTILTARNNAQARGTGWQLQTYWATNALQILYLIEYADLDSQTAIGRGNVDNPAIISTGTTINLGNASGSASGTDGLVNISYRGVESLWGNTYKWVDGINRNSDFEVYLANENFTYGLFSGNYTLVGTITNNYSFVRDILFPHFLSTEGFGTSTTYLNDNFSQATGAGTVGFLFGGGRLDTDSAGLFLWRVENDSSTGTNYNGRLQIL